MKSSNMQGVGRKSGVIVPIAFFAAMIFGVAIYFSSIGFSEPLNPIKGINEKRSQVLLEGRGYDFDDLQKKRYEQQKQDRQENEKKIRQKKRMEEGDGGGSDTSNRDRRNKKREERSGDKVKERGRDKDKGPEIDQGEPGNKVKDPDNPLNPTDPGEEDDGGGDGQAPGEDEEIDEGGPAEDEEDDVGDGEGEDPPPDESDAKKPVISTDLAEGKIYKGKKLRFKISAKDYKGRAFKKFDTNVSIKVWINGDEKYSNQHSEDYTVFKYAWAGKDGNNGIRIQATDRENRTATVSYTVKLNTNEQVKKGRIKLSIEAQSLGLGVLTSGYEDIYQDDNLMEVFERFAKKKGYNPDIEKGSYVAAIRKKNIGKNIDIVKLEKKIKKNGWSWNNTEYSSYKDKLREKYFALLSGWVYFVDGLYHGHGMAEHIPQDGDKVRIRYTLHRENGVD